MLLNRENLKYINPKAVQVPGDELFNLPEKVLQFGTGVLLRALPDYFIDKANKQGVFNGRVVIVKSTSGGDAGVFTAQDNLYTVCVRGIEAGNTIEENLINASVSRVLAATGEWQQVLQCAANAQIEIVISNTTEVGIRLQEENIEAAPPDSFPAKLLACLYHRYNELGKENAPGMIILPTELITDNGNKLKSIISQLAAYNKLPQEFMLWLHSANTFCNTLVDRIVPGKPAAAKLAALETELGYHDGLLTMAEAFRLWAIEGDEKIKSALSFATVDEGVVITPDITVFKELKLRLLNGTHTFCSGPAFLAGVELTRDAVSHPAFGQFMHRLMQHEIGPAIPCKIEAAQRNAFAASTVDRFANTSIDHKWKSITVQYTSKMKMRNLPLLAEYYRKHEALPKYMAASTAACLMYMRANKVEQGVYYGELNGSAYSIEDDNAVYFYEKNEQTNNTSDYCAKILGDADFWQTDFNELPGFKDSVIQFARQIEQQGMLKTLEQLN